MECDSDDYAVRTLLNVVDSDATLLLNMDTLDGGSLLTKKFVAEKDREFMYTTLYGDDGGNEEKESVQESQDSKMRTSKEQNETKTVSKGQDYCAHFGFSNGRAQRVAEWIRVKGIRVLNVAGPRESDRSGIYEAATKFLRDVLKHFQSGEIPDESLFGAYNL